MVRVLFVCLGNSCRSPMAEAIARRNAADVIEASSAGLEPLGFVADATRRILADNGYSTEELESKPVFREAWDLADLVINMSGRPRHLAFYKPSKVEDWEVADPYGADPHVYQTICEEIESRVEALAERLRERSGRLGPEFSERKKD